MSDCHTKDLALNLFRLSGIESRRLRSRTVERPCDSGWAKQFLTQCVVPAKPVQPNYSTQARVFFCEKVGLVADAMMLVHGSTQNKTRIISGHSVQA